MKKAWMKAVLGVSSFSFVLISLFQNCGPAKLVGSASNSSSDQASTVGSLVDLQALLAAASSEPSANIIYTPEKFAKTGGNYVEGSPIFENIILKNNDFSKIEWVHEATATVIASGESFQQKIYTEDLAGNYYIFGYRDQSPYLIGTAVLGNWGSSRQNVNAVGAVTLNQEPLETIGDTQWILLEINAPTVDLKAIEITNQTTGEKWVSKKAVLLSKKTNINHSVEVRLVDDNGQVFLKTLSFPATNQPPTTTTTSTTTTTTTTTTLTQPSCMGALQNFPVSYTCPAGLVVKLVTFASFGTSTGVCPQFQIGTCHASTSKAVVEAACLNKATCSITPTTALFGDPCPGTTKGLNVMIRCGLP